MYTVWTQHIKDADEKIQYEKRLLQSRWVFEDLTTLLNKMEKEIDRVETNPETYDKPNWEYRQADNNGFRRCLKNIKKLITLDQKEQPNDRQSVTA